MLINTNQSENSIKNPYLPTLLFLENGELLIFHGDPGLLLVLDSLSKLSMVVSSFVSMDDCSRWLSSLLANQGASVK